MVAETDVDVLKERGSWAHLIDTVKHLAGGAVAGAAAKTVTAPLDRVKILFQVRVHGFESRSVIGSLQHIYREEGVRGLWRGNSAMLARVMPYAAIQFAAYEEIRNVFAQRRHAGGGQSEELTPGERAIAGSLAGIASVLLTYPLDLARARLATVSVSPGTSGPTSLLRMLRQTAAEGWAASFKGLSATLIGIVPYAGANFYAYGGLKELYRRHYGSDRQPGVAAKLAMGATAGLIAQTLCYPLDVVRRRQQVEGFLPHVDVVRGSWIRVLRSIARSEGIAGLTRGLSINFVKTPMAIAVSFTVYDLLKGVLQSGAPL